MRERCRIWSSLFVVVLCLVSGCNGRPADQSIQELELSFERPELMLVVATERNRYEQIYTSQIWNVEVSGDGTTFQDYLLDQIKLFSTDLQVIVAMAEEYGISLDNGEREQLRRLAQDYYSQLSAGDIAYTGASEEDALELYQDYRLASKTVEELTKNAALEISDSEAKVIEIQQIVLADAAAAQDVQAQVLAEGADFAMIAKANTLEADVDRKIGRGGENSRVEEAAFSLKTGEISPIMEEKGRYYILKCINDYDQEATLKRKEELSLLRKDKAFRELYDAFLEEHPVIASDQIWLGISCQTKEETTTTNLFELYREYFPD